MHIIQAIEDEQLFRPLLKSLDTGRLVDGAAGRLWSANNEFQTLQPQTTEATKNHKPRCPRMRLDGAELSCPVSSVIVDAGDREGEREHRGIVLVCNNK